MAPAFEPRSESCLELDRYGKRSLREEEPRLHCVTERNVLAARSCAALPCVLGLRKINYEETSLLLRYGGSSFTLLHSH
jgi:hypothetical protein